MTHVELFPDVRSLFITVPLGVTAVFVVVGLIANYVTAKYQAKYAERKKHRRHENSPSFN